MPDESQQAKKPERPRLPRARSTIDFPYLDLDNAVQVVQAVRNLGGDSCTATQLATKLNVSADGGGFRMRLFNAKVFGLLAYEKGQLTLTDLGLKIADPVSERRSRYEAFLSVGLFRQLFDKLDGQTLPPAAAIERMMEQMGVAGSQKERARQVFLRSAKQSGFFDLSSDRLSAPPLGPSRAQAASPPVSTARRVAGGGDEPPQPPTPSLHPFIAGLLKTLPPADTAWTPFARLKWLQAAANIFDIIYTVGDQAQEGLQISVKLTTQKGEAENA